MNKKYNHDIKFLNKNRNIFLNIEKIDNDLIINLINGIKLKIEGFLNKGGTGIILYEYKNDNLIEMKYDYKINLMLGNDIRLCLESWWNEENKIIPIITFFQNGQEITTKMAKSII